MSSTQNRRLIERQIQLDASELSVGDTIRTACPFCGAAHERSFTITRQELGLLYNCFRAKCPATGFISSIPGTTTLEKEEQKKKKEFVPRPFEKPLVKLPDEVAQWLFDKYELPLEALEYEGIKYEPEYKRTYAPLFNSEGYEVGGETKKTDFSGDGAPKTLRYPTAQSSGLHYVRAGARRAGPIIVSEDVLSAIKLSKYFKSVALLGTTFNAQIAGELAQQTDTLIMYLDPDAINKALRYRKKYSLYFRNFFVVVGSKDPKDTPHTELQQLLGVYNNEREEVPVNKEMA